MKQSPFGVLVALALVAAGILALLRWNPAPEREGDARPVPSAESPSAEPVALDLGEPAPVGAVSDAEEPVSPSARTAVPGRSESFPLEGVHWIEVTVHAPAGTPADEELELFGLAPVGEQAAAAYAQGVRRFLPSSERWEELLQEGLRWSRRPVRPGETVRLPFPADAPRGIVCLRARYLVEPPQTVQPAETTSLVLEPELGSWLTGELQLSEAARALGPERAQVKLRERELLFSFAPRAETSTDEAQRFELRGLPAGAWSLGVSGDVFVPYHEDLTLVAGERQHVVVVPTDGRSVYGRVRGPGGEAIAGVEVTHHQTVRMEPLERSSRTDGEGRYRLRALPDGQVRLRVAAEGWLRLDDVVTIDGADVEHDLVLERAGSVTGRVVHPDGAAAEGVSIEALYEDRPSSPVQSDAEGRFVVTGLDPLARYDLTAHLSESSSTYWRLTGWAERRDLVPGGPELILTLQPPVGFAGRVVDEAGNPYDAFRVQANRTHGRRSWEGGVQVWERFEEAGGVFRLDGLHPGEWSVTAAADDGVSAMEPVQVSLPSTSDVTLVLPRGVHVQGVVVDPRGEPVVGAGVHTDGYRTWAHSQGDGTFDFGGLTPGTVELSARHEAWAPSEPVRIDVVAGTPPEPVRLVMRVGGRILGEVYDDEGRPAASQRVTVEGSEGTVWFGEPAKTDADGRFVLTRVAPGKVTVMAVSSDAFGGLLSSGKDETDMLNALGRMRTAQVEVVDGEDTYVVLGSEPRRPVRLDGRVTVNGEPLADAMVVALSEGESIFEGMRAGRTDAAGAYELELAGSGFYVLAVSDEHSDPIPITTAFVPSAPNHTLDLEVPIGSIRGTVSEADGAPATGVRVLPIANPPLPGLSELGSVREENTEADGTYALEGLLPGAYDLHVEGTVLEGVELAPGEVLEDVDLRLEARRSFAGRVLDEEGRGVRGARLFVHDTRGRLLAGLEVDQSSDGRFRIEGVPATALQVSARADQGASPPLPVEAGEHDVGELELLLAPGGTLRVSLLLGDEPTLGSLLVRDQEERVVSGPGLLPDDADRLGTPLRLSERVVGPLPPGRYTLEATGSGGTSASRRITLRAGSERTVQLRLR